MVFTVLGPTDPKAAPEGSLRNMILQDWVALGLKDEPNTGDNCVHASASPFEGLAERMNWLKTDPENVSPFFVCVCAVDGNESLWSIRFFLCF